MSSLREESKTERERERERKKDLRQSPLQLRLFVDQAINCKVNRLSKFSRPHLSPTATPTPTLTLVPAPVPEAQELLQNRF